MRSGTQSFRVLKTSWVAPAARLPSRIGQTPNDRDKSLTRPTHAQLSSQRVSGRRHCFGDVHACSLYLIVGGELASTNSQSSFLDPALKVPLRGAHAREFEQLMNKLRPRKAPHGDAAERLQHR